MANTTTHINPKDRGEHIYLRPEAQAAWRLYVATLNDRIATTNREQPENNVDMEKVQAILDGQRGEIPARLFRAALDNANTETLTGRNPMTTLIMRFNAARQLNDLHDQIDPAPRHNLVYDTSDTCSHGMPFSATCDRCEP